jgi:hypothetical protein
MEWLKRWRERGQEPKKIDTLAKEFFDQGIYVKEDSGAVTIYRGSNIAGSVLSDFNDLTSIGFDNPKVDLEDFEQQTIWDSFAEGDPIIHSHQLLIKDNERNTKTKSLPNSSQGRQSGVKSFYVLNIS